MQDPQSAVASLIAAEPGHGLDGQSSLASAAASFKNVQPGLTARSDQPLQQSFTMMAGVSVSLLGGPQPPFPAEEGKGKSTKRNTAKTRGARLGSNCCEQEGDPAEYGSVFPRFYAKDLVYLFCAN